MKIKFLLLFFFFPLFLNAQEIADSVYWVYFRDKDGSKYQIDQAKEFLSERSLNRRAWQGIGVDQRDLPVNGDYVQAIKDLGIEVRHVSRWLNGAVFVNADSAQFEEVLSMEFIDTLAWMPESNDRYFPHKTMGERFSPPLETSPDFSYGIAMEQVTMLKTDRLHDLGYTGKGVWIAVLDGGFNNVDSLPSFEALIAEDRLVGTRNFVNDRHVFREGSSHGMSVLSTMGGEWDGYLVGTAPHASYLLCTTENTSKETRIEEIAWIEAAEYADSLGWEVIKTALG